MLLHLICATEQTFDIFPSWFHSSCRGPRCFTSGPVCLVAISSRYYSTTFGHSTKFNCDSRVSTHRGHFLLCFFFFTKKNMTHLNTLTIMSRFGPELEHDSIHRCIGFQQKKSESFGLDHFLNWDHEGNFRFGF